MEMFIIAASLMGFMMLAMSVGVIFSGKELKGSCGGVGGNCPCADSGTPGACKLPDEEGLINVNQNIEGHQNTGIHLERTEAEGGVQIYTPRS